jgi:hypothetical protein
MLIQAKSMLTGVEHQREIEVTLTQYAAWQNSGKPIQEVLGHLSADDREFLMTGITPEEWEEAFPEE